MKISKQFSLEEGNMHPLSVLFYNIGALISQRFSG